MPCETFSTAGNSSRSFYDDRQVLYREGIRIAKLCNAKILLFENVPAITSKRIAKDSAKLVVDMIKEELTEAGYGNFIQVVLDAADFGVPQRRKRFFILSTRFSDWKLVSPSPANREKVTVRDALSDLPDVVPNSNVEGTAYVDVDSPYSLLMKNDVFWRRVGFGKEQITNHLPMKHRDCTLKRFSLLQPGESLKSLLTDIRVKKEKCYRNGESCQRRCLSSGTIVCHLMKHHQPLQAIALMSLCIRHLIVP